MWCQTGRKKCEPPSRKSEISLIGTPRSLVCRDFLCLCSSVCYGQAASRGTVNASLKELVVFRLVDHSASENTSALLNISTKVAVFWG